MSLFDEEPFQSKLSRVIHDYLTDFAKKYEYPSFETKDELDEWLENDFTDSFLHFLFWDAGWDCSDIDKFVGKPSDILFMVSHLNWFYVDNCRDAISWKEYDSAHLIEHYAECYVRHYLGLEALYEITGLLKFFPQCCLCTELCDDLKGHACENIYENIADGVCCDMCYHEIERDIQKGEIDRIPYTIMRLEQKKKDCVLCGKKMVRKNWRNAHPLADGDCCASCHPIVMKERSGMLAKLNFGKKDLGCTKKHMTTPEATMDLLKKGIATPEFEKAI
jgi:hypothetical protein